MVYLECNKQILFGKGCGLFLGTTFSDCLIKQKGGELYMSKRLFVGGLSEDITETELTSIFEDYGQVESCSIILDRITRNNKGFGFVEMVNDADATSAIEALDGTELNGKKIAVNVAKPREERGRDHRNNDRGFRQNNNYSRNNRR